MNFQTGDVFLWGTRYISLRQCLDFFQTKIAIKRRKINFRTKMRPFSESTFQELSFKTTFNMLTFIFGSIVSIKKVLFENKNEF